jgi:hypothetical protein
VAARRRQSVWLGEHFARLGGVGVVRHIAGAIGLPGEHEQDGNMFQECSKTPGKPSRWGVDPGGVRGPIKRLVDGW